MFESLVTYSDVRNLQLFMNYMGGVHCCNYDKIYLQLIDMDGLRLQRAVETDIYSNGSRCNILLINTYYVVYICCTIYGGIYGGNYPFPRIRGST